MDNQAQTDAAGTQTGCLFLPPRLDDYRRVAGWVMQVTELPMQEIISPSKAQPCFFARLLLVHCLKKEGFNHYFIMDAVDRDRTTLYHYFKSFVPTIAAKPVFAYLVEAIKDLEVEYNRMQVTKPKSKPFEGSLTRKEIDEWQEKMDKRAWERMRQRKK